MDAAVKAKIDALFWESCRSLTTEKPETAATMTPPALSDLEYEFARLSPEVQLSLLERLLHRTWVTVSDRRDTWDADLAAMAADPEMQRELSCIKAEFDVTEADGLERH